MPAWPACWPRVRPRPSCMRRPTSGGGWRRASPSRLDTIYGGGEVFAKKVSEAQRRQVPDQRARGRRSDAGLRRGRRRAERDGRDRAHGAVLLLRQGRDLRDRRVHPVRAELAADDGVDLPRQRPEADARVLPELQHHQLPRRQHRRADGGLVPQGDQVGGGLQGPEVPHRRLRRPGDRAHGRRAAEPAGRRGSIRRWRRARSTPRNGSDRTTT